MESDIFSVYTGGHAFQYKFPAAVRRLRSVVRLASNHQGAPCSSLAILLLPCGRNKKISSTRDSQVKGCLKHGLLGQVRAGDESSECKWK